MVHIGVVWHFPQYEEYFKTVTAEAGFDVEISFRLGNLAAGIIAAKELETQCNVDVIIARGHTGELIRDAIDTPVIIVENSNFDLLQAIHRARKKGSKIAFIDFQRSRQYYDLELLTELSGTDVKCITFEDISEIDGIINMLAGQGYDVVIGTGQCTIRGTAKNGMQSVVLETSRADIISSIQRALSTLEINRREKEKNRWMKAIYDNAKEGYMLITSQGDIAVFNSIMAAIFEVEADDVINKKIDNILAENPEFQKIFSMAEASGELATVMGRSVIVSRFPLQEDGVLTGILINVQNASNIHDLDVKARKHYLKKGFVAKASFRDIIRESPAMEDVVRKAVLYARTKSNIIIYGETGTGKELFAQSIHNRSGYAKGPFVAINCASFPPSLLESELFGYEEGAFTGAKKGGKLGIFELAHNGTIFLDEIGEMGLNLQSGLLRVLQEKEVIRLGGDRVVPIDVRVICATNKDLLSMVKEGRFREDLYYRINVLKLRIPPLRERGEDAWEITKSILRAAGDKHIETKTYMRNYLCSYAWPGNVRELQGFLECVLAMQSNGTVDEGMFRSLFLEYTGNNSAPAVSNQPVSNDTVAVRISSMNDMEMQIIKALYEATEKDKEKMARILQISGTTLWRKLKELE